MYKTIFLLLLFVIQSCSNPNKSNNKSKSDFLAYYNTFYNAEKYYNEALEIIKVNQTDIIPQEADILLDKAVGNALVIEKDFYNSKYLDDSYYILAMSSYYKNNITSSDYYFNRILSEHKQSEFYNSALIMYGNLYLKMNKINDVEILITKINNELELDNNEKYLFHLLLADYYSFLNSFNEVNKNYLIALDHSSNDNDKIFIYYELLKLAENSKNFDNAINFIDKIQNILDDQRISEDLFSKWIDYNIKNKNYDQIVSLLNDYINKENVLKTKIYYETELANVFLYKKEYQKAKNILVQLINEYNENALLKKELGEAYYLLGNLYLNFGFDFDNAKEAYQSCIDISKTSYFGKESDKKIISITDYLNLQDEIFYINSISQDEKIQENDILSGPIPIDNNKKLDSLIFNSGQILYFDLGVKDSAIFKFKNLVDNYNESKYRYKSLLILDMEQPNANWTELLNNEYTDLTDSLSEIDFLIDKAWDLLSDSYEKSIDSFLSIYNKYDNEKSLYIVGFIYDDYVKDIDNAILYYKMYLDKYEEGDFSVKIKDRLLDIEEMIGMKSKFYEQRVNLRKGIRWFENSFNIDSSLYYIDLASRGIESNIIVYSNNISESIRKYDINAELLRNNYLSTDSVKLNIAHILYKELSLDEQAIEYYKQLLSTSNTKKYINETYACLSLLEKNITWDSLLFSDVNDSNLFYILKNNAKRKFQYNLNGTIESDSLDLLWFNKIKEKYFFKTAEENNSKIE